MYIFIRSGVENLIVNFLTYSDNVENYYISLVYSNNYLSRTTFLFIDNRSIITMNSTFFLIDDINLLKFIIAIDLHSFNDNSCSHKIFTIHFELY